MTRTKPAHTVHERPRQQIGWTAPQARAEVVDPADMLILDHDAVVIDPNTGEPALVTTSVELEPWWPDLMRQVGPKYQALTVKTGRGGGGIMKNTGRQSGITTNSVIFGFSPPAPARKRYASMPSAFNRAHPKEFQQLETLVARCAGAVLALCPEAPLGDWEHTIGDAWRLGTSPYTSGIINQGGAAYPYHKDANNIPGSWSTMPIIRGKRAAGGLLVVPEYGVAVPAHHGQVVAFPGADVWHGVTPIRGERWSVVFYAQEGLKYAAPTLTEELRAGNRRRTAYEMRGAGRTDDEIRAALGEVTGYRGGSYLAEPEPTNDGENE